MRYWILVVLLNGLFALVMYFAAPEMLGSTTYYAGVAICAVMAFIITWRDPPGLLDNVLVFLCKWGVLVAGLALFVWGTGYRLAFWGTQDSGELVSSAYDTMIPDLAMLTGILIMSGFYLLIRKR
ncbi:hypothetical protein FR830_25155 (plasmid) [Klebsiella aerogenes]|uniref:hypothetical protein n=1 Tax=Klebsiella aerogenes TaxID=548 RepID=UPI00124C8A83|nr:hypothetical protein [Klebsiella aerogenes]QFI19906.1 hypothetical protein FR830_25155 [Klebsiella aerogenes]